MSTLFSRPFDMNIPPESLNLLVNTVQELSLARDLTTVMQIIRTAARNLVEADGATFVLREKDVCYYADEDAISPLWKGSRFPISACISGWSMLNRQAAVIEDIYADYRVPADAYRPTFVKSLVMVPIRTIDPVGAIGTYWATSRMPKKEQVWLLQSLADITAVTIENVKVYEEMEQRVAERTQQLQSVNKELEAFTYTVSHDLKAPLRIINGYIDILIEDHGSEFSGKSLQVMSTIKERGANLSRLIDDLLTFFKLSTKPLQKTVVDMKRIVSDITSDISSNEKERSIEFIVHDLPPVPADGQLIKQVWQNLISNAVKYSSGKSAAVIEINGEQIGQFYTYTVKDNGAGFDMRFYNKLFGVFQRLHSPQEFEGNGIGLASAKRIIDKHGGVIWGTATEGEGATFSFSLPG